MWLDLLKDAVGLGIRRCYLMIAARRGPGTTRWHSLLRFWYECEITFV